VGVTAQLSADRYVAFMATEATGRFFRLRK